MTRSVKSLLCIVLSAATIVLCCSCGNEESPQATTAETAKTTVAPETTSVSTDDTAAAQPATYNYVMIKQKSDEITNDFDKIISGKKYKGATYLKIGNDFEYINVSGTANSEKHINNSINTCYYTGSVTKQLTSAAVMLLYEQGKLSLDENISKYYPSYEYADKITVKNLLTMTSGIKNYMLRESHIDNFVYVQPEVNMKISKDNSASENKKVIMDWILSQDLLFEPDSEYRYSDSNYYILGDIIEQASGVSYEKFVFDNLLKPLSMTSSGFDKTEKLAVSYQGRNDNESTLYPGVGYSSSGFISNISDLLKWVDGLAGGDVVSTESLDEMFTAYKENFGYGFFVYGNRLSSTGKTENYNSMLSFTKDKSEIFVSLSNYAYSEPIVIYRNFKNSISKFYR